MKLKKLLLIFVISIMFIPFVVNAETCENDKISIESIEISSISENVVEKNEPVINGMGVKLDLEMSEVDDSIEYEMTIKNDSSSDYKLDKNSLNIESDYIDYTFETKDKTNIVKAKTSSEAVLTIQYRNEVPEELLEDGSFTDNKIFSIGMNDGKNIINPKTAQSLLFLIYIVLTISIVSLVVLKKNKKIGTLAILLGLLSLPFSVYALCSINLNVESNVGIIKIYKITYSNNISSVSGDISTAEYFNSDSDVVKNNMFVVNNYVFKEWNTNSDGTGIKYKPGQRIELNECITLYAMWRDKNSVSGIIYWALQDNDNNSINETLVLSSINVNGVLSGSFSGDAVFRNTREVPWINGNGYNGDNLSDNVQLVKVENVISPASIKYWFWYVGYRATGTLNFMLEDLDTSNVTDMSYVFNYAGAYGPSTINMDLSSWDVSNVTTMERMFQAIASTGTKNLNMNLSGWNLLNSTNISNMFSVIGGYSTVNDAEYNMDLSGWNMPKISSFERFFEGFGENNNKVRSSSVFLNLTGWSFPNVTTMQYMFFHTSRNNTSQFVLEGLDSWDVSHVNNMSGMFDGAGMKAQVWNIGNISNWNVSCVNNMDGMFSYAGYNTNEFKLDLSNWNTSCVADMKNMFYSSGNSASNWSIIIPKTNGNGLNNSSSKMYGMNNSVYGELSQSGRTFTLVN